MSFNYAGTAQTVLRLLQRFGAATTLNRPGEATYDPETGIASATGSPVTVQAAVFPVEARFVDGSMVLATDQQAYLSAVGVSEPKPGDVLAWRGQSLTVVKARNLAPAGTFVLYELIVRA